ncbi:MAG: J domain-containing protein [Desulfovibrionales bacterium]|nr:J domain-containing protein [Desulfovibrionales bacterium]
MHLEIHPNAVRLLAQIDDLRQRVGDLLEEQAHLRSHAIPVLMAIYEKEIGAYEYALLAVRVEANELKFRVESLMQIINRGGRVEAVDLERIDAEVHELQSVWEREMADKARQVDAAQEFLKEIKYLSQDQELQMKKLYRALCFLLHPDMNGDMALRETYWDHVQAAYGAGDLVALGALWIAARDGRGVIVDERSSLDALTAERDRLEQLVLEHTRRIGQTRKNPPLCLERELRDPAWIAAKQEELRSAQAAMRARRDELRALCHQLMAQGAVQVH